MRNLIVTEFISLDGVVEAPGGEAGYPHSGWVGGYFSDELGAYKFAEQDAAEILLLGRVTYESFYGAWPQREGAMAEKINTMTKVVASHTLASSEWEGTTVTSDLLGTVRELKQGDGGPILVAGSRSVAQALLAAGLVDQVNLQVFPVILGSGFRLYPETADPIRLELIASDTQPNGVQTQSYRVLAS
jgi:dihydrofolate reductase